MTNPLIQVNAEMDEIKAAILASTDGVVARHCQGRMYVTAKDAAKGPALAALKIAFAAAADFAAANYPDRFSGHKVRGHRYFWTYCGNRPDRLRFIVRTKMTEEERSAVLIGMK